MGLATRGVAVLALAVICLRAAVAVAAAETQGDVLATQPASDATPQAFLAYTTNDRVATMTVEQAMGLFNFNPDSDKDKTTAKLMATSAITESKLEVAVREKWGKEAETAVAHACGDNVPDDGAQARWTIRGDQAVADFQLATLTPVFLVKKDGHWKYDMEAYRGDDKDKTDRDLKASSVVLERLNQELAKKDAFPTAEAFTKHVKDEMDKVGAGN